MFSPSQRRRRKASPSPEKDTRVGSPPLDATPESGRRRHHLNYTPEAHHVSNGLSTRKKKPPSQLPTFQPGSTCNHFLLGGQFYPGKDKKRKHLRRRAVWYRVFFSSPLRAGLSLLILSYVLVWHVFVPGTHKLLELGRTISGGGKHGFMDLSSLHLPPLKEQQMESLRIREERNRIQYSSDKRHEARMQILASIVPDWFHRNDRDDVSDTKQEERLNVANVNKTGEELDDKIAHEQHERRDGGGRVLPKPRKGSKVQPVEKITKRGSRRRKMNIVSNKVDTKVTTDEIGADKVSGSEKVGNTTVDGEKRGSPASNKTDAPEDARKTESKPEKGGEGAPDMTTAADKSPGDGTKAVERTLQNMDSMPPHSRCPSILSADDIKTTLVIQSSLERLWILSETCQRWTSPIVVAIYLPHDADDKHYAIAAARATCPQLTVLTYKASSGDVEWEYPVNRLRNMALDAVNTSHVLVTDIDFVPSIKLDELIQATVMDQSEIVDSLEREAMIVPAFERIPPEPCSNDHDCSVYLKANSSFVPHTLSELRICVSRNECTVFQMATNWEGHYSTRSATWLGGEWYEASNATNGTSSERLPTKRIRSIKCFDSLRYEPYVVLRWCPVSSSGGDNKTPIAPYYDERFYGYGKNKIQLISHLRFLGYRFAVLPRGFIVHNPHLDSTAKQAWTDVKVHSLHQDMDALYPQFLEELWTKYKGTTSIVRQCQRHKPKQNKKTK